jgi:chemotaxis protein CheX
MNVEYINPFINATLNVVTTMAFVKVNAGSPHLNKESVTTDDLTGLIGLAGSNVVGSVIISFSEKAILQIVSNMLGETFETMTPDVSDAVGEITNMIVGGAKRMLADKGFKFNLALPTIIKGKGVTLQLKTRGPRVVVPFTIEDSGATFKIEACIEEH